MKAVFVVVEVYRSSEYVLYRAYDSFKEALEACREREKSLIAERVYNKTTQRNMPKMGSSEMRARIAERLAKLDDFNKCMVTEVEFYTKRT